MNTAETRTFVAPHDRPCASAGLTSYRYPANHRVASSGWVMIGATSPEEALREAARSLNSDMRCTLDALQVWNGSAYVPCLPAPVVAPVAGVTDPLECECDAGKLLAGELPAPAAAPAAMGWGGAYAAKPVTVSRIPAVVDGDADQWGRDLFAAGLSFHFDDPPAEILGSDGQPLFTAQECAELEAILDGFTGEQYDAAMSGVLDALHEENRALRSRGVIDDAGKDDMHGKRGNAPVVPAGPSVESPAIFATLEALGFVVEDSGGGHEFYKREAGKGLCVLVTGFDGYSLPMNDVEPVRVALVRSADLLEIGAFVVDSADLVSKLSTL